MNENETGDWIKYEDVADLQRQLGDAIRERDEWNTAYEMQHQVYLDIGANLGATLPEELINVVARRRMQELADAIRERDQYKAACGMATALRPLGAVQVVEGGAAVLLDTGRK